MNQCIKFGWFEQCFVSRRRSALAVRNSCPVHILVKVWTPDTARRRHAQVQNSGPSWSGLQRHPPRSEHAVLAPLQPRPLIWGGTRSTFTWKKHLSTSCMDRVGCEERVGAFETNVYKLPCVTILDNLLLWQLRPPNHLLQVV